MFDKELKEKLENKCKALLKLRRTAKDIELKKYIDDNFSDILLIEVIL